MWQHVKRMAFTLCASWLSTSACSSFQSVTESPRTARFHSILRILRPSQHQVCMYVFTESVVGQESLRTWGLLFLLPLLSRVPSPTPPFSISFSSLRFIAILSLSPLSHLVRACVCVCVCVCVWVCIHAGEDCCAVLVKAAAPPADYQQTPTGIAPARYLP